MKLRAFETFKALEHEALETLNLVTLKPLRLLEPYYPRHPQNIDTIASSRDGGRGSRDSYVSGVDIFRRLRPSRRHPSFLGAGEAARHGTAHCGRVQAPTILKPGRVDLIWDPTPSRRAGALGDSIDVGAPLIP